MSIFALVRSIFMILCEIPRFQGGTVFDAKGRAMCRYGFFYLIIEKRMLRGEILKQNTPNTKEGGNRAKYMPLV